MFTGTDIFEFFKHFSHHEQCLSYLSDAKWEDDFTCIKCGNTSCCKTKSLL